MSVLTRTGRKSWTYGRIEVRAKLPTGKGMWPASWMLGTNISQVGWPACGEIDIMENVGFDPDRIYGSIHTQDYNHVLGTGKGANLTVDAPYDDSICTPSNQGSQTLGFSIGSRKLGLL